MRTVLVTGTGGSGRSTVAAATALACARTGQRTLLLGTDRDTAPGTPALGEEPEDERDDAEPAPGLAARLVDPAGRFREEAERAQARMSEALEMFGVAPLDPEELTEPPGTEGLALLRSIREEADTGEWDVIVVDCPPVTATVAALALPEQLRRYLDRVLPEERQAARALRPLLAALAGVPMPAEWLYSAAAWARDELSAAQALVEDNATTVRLVVEPGAAAVRKVRTARAALALYGHRLEAVVANRVLPEKSSDPFLAGLAERQGQDLKMLREDCAGLTRPTGLPVVELPHLGREPEGVADLARLAETGGLAVRPRTPGRAPEPWTVEDGPEDAEAEGFVWRLPLPGAERPDLDLVRLGDELVIDLGAHRRIVPLPSGLRRCTVTGAALREGELRVRFAPDPGQWPSR